MCFQDCQWVRSAGQVAEDKINVDRRRVGVLSDPYIPQCRNDLPANPHACRTTSAGPKSTSATSPPKPDRENHPSSSRSSALQKRSDGQSPAHPRSLPPNRSQFPRQKPHQRRIHRHRVLLRHPMARFDNNLAQIGTVLPHRFGEA